MTGLGPVDTYRRLGAVVDIATHGLAAARNAASPTDAAAVQRFAAALDGTMRMHLAGLDESLMAAPGARAGVARLTQALGEASAPGTTDVPGHVAVAQVREAVTEVNRFLHASAEHPRVAAQRAPWIAAEHAAIAAKPADERTVADLGALSDIQRLPAGTRPAGVPGEAEHSYFDDFLRAAGVAGR